MKPLEFNTGAIVVDYIKLPSCVKLFPRFNLTGFFTESLALSLQEEIVVYRTIKFYLCPQTHDQWQLAPLQVTGRLTAPKARGIILTVALVATAGTWSAVLSHLANNSQLLSII